MRKLSDAEVLSLRELLQMDTNALSQVKAMEPFVTDNDLKAQLNASMLTTENRIKGMQQFIIENEVISVGEVH